MKKKIYLRLIIGVIAIVLIGIIVWQLAPLMFNLTTHEGQIEFKEKINNMGIWGGLTLFGLELLQIVLVILPAEPLEILAGMCYGKIGGTLFILFAAFISTSMIYLLVGILGRNFLHEIISKDKLEKIEDNKILKNTKGLEIAMAILFFIPGTPKDLLVYIGALLPIKPIRFILISTFARFPSIISSTIVGDRLSEGDVTISLIIYAITGIITILGIYISRKKGGKETGELMKILKK